MKWEYKIYTANIANVFTANPPGELGVVLEGGGGDHDQLPGDGDARLLHVDQLDQPKPPKP